MADLRLLLSPKCPAMKQILFPTDFSTVSANAFLYAQELAQKLHAELRVIHVYHPTVDAANPYLNMPTPDLAELKEKYLQQFVNKYQLAVPDGSATPAPIATELHLGVPVDEIIRLSANADLLIMSTRGESNVVRRLFGSVTTAVARRAQCPTLLIPPEARFTDISQLLFATDYAGHDETLLRKSLRLWRPLYPKMVHFVHVSYHDSMDYAIADARFEEIVQEETPEIGLLKAEVQCERPLQGILDYAQDNRIDVIIMGTIRRNFFEQLFHHSTTKGAILESNRPILIGHLE